LLARTSALVAQVHDIYVKPLLSRFPAQKHHVRFVAIPTPTHAGYDTVSGEA
jgi:hypothetical protein